jgi:putative transposase
LACNGILPFLESVLLHLWERIKAELRTELRTELRVDGRESEPNAAILDSQSAKTTETPRVRGYDTDRRLKGESVTFWWI